jgi:hypothetical protein
VSKWWGVCVGNVGKGESVGGCDREEGCKRWWRRGVGSVECDYPASSSMYTFTPFSLMGRHLDFLFSTLARLHDYAEQKCPHSKPSSPPS